MTDAIHYFDLFTYLLGQAPIAVTATLRDYLGRGMDDCSFATVEYGRIPAFVEAGYFAPGTYRDCVIVGERATLAADFGNSEVRVHANQHVKGAGGWQAPEGPVESVKASGKEPLSQTRLFRGRLVQLIAFNHLYHLEHHLYPAVPHHHWKSLADRLDPLVSIPMTQFPSQFSNANFYDGVYPLGPAPIYEDALAFANANPGVKDRTQLRGLREIQQII
jgi:hypothetical protein